MWRRLGSINKTHRQLAADRGRLPPPLPAPAGCLPLAPSHPSGRPSTAAGGGRRLLDVPPDSLPPIPDEQPFDKASSRLVWWNVLRASHGGGLQMPHGDVSATYISVPNTVRATARRKREEGKKGREKGKGKEKGNGKCEALLASHCRRERSAALTCPAPPPLHAQVLLGKTVNSSQQPDEAACATACRVHDACLLYNWCPNGPGARPCEMDTGAHRAWLGRGALMQAAPAQVWGVRAPPCLQCWHLCCAPANRPILVTSLQLSPSSSLAPATCSSGRAQCRAAGARAILGWAAAGQGFRSCCFACWQCSDP